MSKTICSGNEFTAFSSDGVQRWTNCLSAATSMYVKLSLPCKGSTKGLVKWVCSENRMLKGIIEPKGETVTDSWGKTPYWETSRLIVLVRVTTSQAMYILRNIDPCSCNHCCRAKGISIKYPECVFVALGIQHAMHMRLIFMRSRPVSAIFFRLISQRARLPGTSHWIKNVYFDFLYKFFCSF